MSNIPIVTIDGPGGSGKGTVSKMLASKLGWNILESGALYRILALYALQKNCALEQEDMLVELAKNLPVKFENEKTLLEDKDVASQIRTEQCGDFASKIAAIPRVRQALMERQQQFSKLPGLIADGRDMGTVVFPEAFLKIYLDASVDERAKRRYLQLKQAGFDVKLEHLKQEISARDLRDKTRAVAPLRPADNAVIIDTSNMQISEVFNEIMRLIEKRLS